MEPTHATATRDRTLPADLAAELGLLAPASAVTGRGDDPADAHRGQLAWAGEQGWTTYWCRHHAQARIQQVGGVDLRHRAESSRSPTGRVNAIVASRTQLPGPCSETSSPDQVGTPSTRGSSLEAPWHQQVGTRRSGAVTERGRRGG